MKKCTYGVYSGMVQVRIDGTPNPKGFPYCPDDGDLITEFLKFLTASNIRDLHMGGMCGGGRYRGFFAEEDAERIEAWLKERANEESEETIS